MGLTTPCSDYMYHRDSWEKTRDVSAGALRIFKKGDRYLYRGRMDEKAYKDYLYRAIFVGYVDKIEDFSCGQLLRNKPQTSGIPDELINDVDLCGTNLISFIDHTARELMEVERMGLWFDYSEGQQRPYVVSVKAENIIKWNYGYAATGEKVLLSVVLETEESTVDPSTFDEVCEKRWIVLFLNAEGHFQKDTYKQAKDGKGGIADELIDSIIPVAGVGGLPLEFIPFKIVSAKGKPDRIHTAPMLPIAEINLSLYRSMASREQLLFYYGMPTLIARGWEKSDPFPLGGVAAFPKEGGAEFAQVAVEEAVDKAIQSKKEEIAQLGSSFLSGRGKYVASATTADINQEGDNASLSSLANTISRALTETFTDMQIYGYDGLESPSISVNTEFEEPQMQRGELAEIGAEVAAGRMSFPAYFNMLNKNKMYPPEWSLEDEQAALLETAKMIANNKTQIPGVTF